jgi:sugar/nucleoside kinase (ribokinase family)
MSVQFSQGCGIVIITLGAHGCYGASADESRLRKLLGNAYPVHPTQTRPAFAGHRVFIPAFACEGTVNSVGAGDSFLAGVVAALCHYSAPTLDTPLDLAHLLRIGTPACVSRRNTMHGFIESSKRHLLIATGAASSCFKVDSAKSSCPPLPVLLKRMEELKSRPLDSARLLCSVGRNQP